MSGDMGWECQAAGQRDMAVPKAVVLLCGKRKSGKDYVASKLEEMFGDSLSILRLSNPIKEQYAKNHGLDLDRLLDSSLYKEKYRYGMITWGEQIRDKDPFYFCRLVTERADKPVWLVSDARRPSDMSYFKSTYEGRTFCVRVVASEAVRVGRGWVYTPGVDDAPSECALDGYEVDMTISNNDGDNLTKPLEVIRSFVSQRTS